MKCICVKDCFKGRRYKPGDSDYFDEVPSHFISAESYKVENERKLEAAKSPGRSMQEQMKKLQIDNKKLKAENKKLKVPAANKAPTARA